MIGDEWVKSAEELINNSPKPSMRKIEEGFFLFDNITNHFKKDNN